MPPCNSTSTQQTTLGSWLLNRLQSGLCRRVVFAKTFSGKTILSGKTSLKFLSSITLQGFPSIIEAKAVDFWKNCKLDFVERWSLLRCISWYSDPSGKTTLSGKTIFPIYKSHWITCKLNLSEMTTCLERPFFPSHLGSSFQTGFAVPEYLLLDAAVIWPPVDPAGQLPSRHQQNHVWPSHLPIYEIMQMHAN